MSTLTNTPCFFPLLFHHLFPFPFFRFTLHLARFLVVFPDPTPLRSLPSPSVLEPLICSPSSLLVGAPVSSFAFLTLRFSFFFYPETLSDFVLEKLLSCPVFFPDWSPSLAHRTDRLGLFPGHLALFFEPHRSFSFEVQPPPFPSPLPSPSVCHLKTLPFFFNQANGPPFSPSLELFPACFLELTNPPFYRPTPSYFFWLSPFTCPPHTLR